MRTQILLNNEAETKLLSQIELQMNELISRQVINNQELPVAAAGGDAKKKKKKKNKKAE